jgi:hypothetical protein
VAAKMDGWMIFGVLLGFLRISSANSAPVTSYFTLSLSLCSLWFVCFFRIGFLTRSRSVP